MKIFLITLIILALIALAFQIYASMAAANSESQAYDVIKVEKFYEIRYYPSTTLAVITSTDKNFKDLGSSGFKTLAGYIFGENIDNQQIAMTSPVHMDIGDSISKMSFVMPSCYNKENLPKPNDTDIKIKTSTDEYVAATRFGGFANEEIIKSQTVKLENALKQNQVSYHGNFRYLGYNPPYQLFNRRNEIIVALHIEAE